MPLRNHFKPPIHPRHTWEGLHSSWPLTIVNRLYDVLPTGFLAEPNVRIGNQFNVDIGTNEDPFPNWSRAADFGEGGTATALAPWAPPQPTVVTDDVGEAYEFSVSIYREDETAESGRVLVAAIELVSPGNKDRPFSRRALVAKCSALLRKGVCVSLVDLVVPMNFNLYADLLDLFGTSDPTLSSPAPSTYASTCRTVLMGSTRRLESWGFPMSIGAPLPTLPITLLESQGVTLDLDASYEDVCRTLRLP